MVPYWQGAVKYARAHGIRRIALEMHPNFMVYNPLTLLKLRDAVGEEIGANNDLSHLFWQGCNPVEVIHMLGKQGAIYHAHMKDTVLFPGQSCEVWRAELHFRKEGFEDRVGRISRGRLRTQRQRLEGHHARLHGSWAMTGFSA